MPADHPTFRDVRREAAHGRFARRVVDIPRAGWRDIVWRVHRRLDEHHMSLLAGGVSFFLILSVFPAIGSVVSLYGLLADPTVLQNQLDNFAGVLPTEARSLLADHFSRFVQQDPATLGIAFLTALAVALWFANAGLKALFMALNVVYGEREKRNFLKFNLDSFGAALALLLVAFLLTVVTIVTPILLGRLGLGSAVEWAVSILRWPTLFLAATLALVILYRIGPSRTRARWRWIIWGSAFTACAWLIVSGGFSIYLARFGNYEVTYGSLGAVAGFMVWTYFSVYVLLVGAEINAEIEHQVMVDTTVGPGRPMGLRGAVKADTIGPSRPR